MPPRLPEKIYFKIGEVSEIVGVEPYVLRPRARRSRRPPAATRPMRRSASARLRAAEERRRARRQAQTK